jgi:hypothetical protein
MNGTLRESHLLAVQFLFNEIETGQGFVRNARKHSDPAKRLLTLTYARHSHDVVVGLAAQTPFLAEEDRERLTAAVQALQSDIDACARAQ